MGLELHLQNFKCFRDQVLELQPLTVLAGHNGAGKSTVIQSLLILRSAVRTRAKTVPLNGLFGLDLGTIQDVQNTHPTGDFIAISLTDGRSVIECAFNKLNDGDAFLTLAEEPRSSPKLIGGDDGFSFNYLTSERNGPRDSCPVQSQPPESLGIGARGEFTADTLSVLGRRRIRRELTHRLAATGRELNDTLEHNAQLWFQDIFPGMLLDADRNAASNSATIRFRRDGLYSEWTRPGNVGFGLSYCLPIIVAGLLTPPEGMLIVENPEAHLHPAGQSSMARFLATVAASGVTVMVETHSDHVLNGLRLACVDAHPISTAQIAIYHLSRPDDDDVVCERVGITDRGNLTAWPIGFFDQTDADLKRIIEARGRTRG